MSSIYHIFLYSLLFSLYYFWGRYFSNEKNNTRFWLSAIIPILLYSLIVGSRYGWGNDYLFYRYRMENAFTYDEEQAGFRWLNQAIMAIGLNYVGGFIIYSLIFITSAFALIHSFKASSKYMYILLLPASLIFINYAIRQGIAISFTLLAIHFFNKKKWISVIVSILIAASIHTSSLATVLMIYSIYFILKKPVSWKLTIPLYLFFTFFYNISNTSVLSTYVQYLSLNSGLQFYIDNADRWFGQEAINDIYEQSTFALISSSAFYTSIIFLGYQALKCRPSSNIIYIYNSMTFGIILYRAVFLFEILRRFAEPLIMLYFITLGYTVYVYINAKRKNFSYDDIGGYKLTKMDFQLYKVGIIFILSYLFLFWGRFIFMSPDKLFFWNA